MHSTSGSLWAACSPKSNFNYRFSRRQTYKQSHTNDEGRKGCKLFHTRWRDDGLLLRCFSLKKKCFSFQATSFSAAFFFCFIQQGKKKKQTRAPTQPFSLITIAYDFVPSRVVLLCTRSDLQFMGSEASAIRSSIRRARESTLTSNHVNGRTERALWRGAQKKGSIAVAKFRRKH